MVEDYITEIGETMNEELIPNKSRLGWFVCAFFVLMLGFTAVGCTSGESNSVESSQQHKPISTMPDEFISDEFQSPVDGGESSLSKPETQDENVEIVPNSNKKVSEALDANSEKNKKGQSSEVKVNTGDVDVIANENSQMVAIAVVDLGRNDPFVPFSEQNNGSKNKELDLKNIKLKYDLVDPPNSSRADSDAERVLTTKVSGIMYDPQSPSAILNIEDSDYLVRSGDVINGYKVLAIEPTIVTVQLGANIYKAGVGGLLETDGIQYNTISNLDKKFGGSKE